MLHRLYEKGCRQPGAFFGGEPAFVPRPPDHLVHDELNLNELYKDCVTGGLFSLSQDFQAFFHVRCPTHWIRLAQELRYTDAERIQYLIGYAGIQTTYNELRRKQLSKARRSFMVRVLETGNRRF